MAKSKRRKANKRTGDLFRHGDVLILEVSEAAVPDRLCRLPRPVLAEGEVSGHAHRVEVDVGSGAGEPEPVELYEDDAGVMYLRVKGAKARVVHEEHEAIELDGPAVYRVWKQREYDPTRDRYVAD